ncbi:MAG TPA: glycosyltransferase family 39 protein [Tepidisphaeraceae bacterium]|jgi:uncharacterized membrane protein
MPGNSRHHFWLLVVALFAVVAGVYFRVARLDRRLFWYDECFTALKLSGHRFYVATDALLDGRVKSIAEARQYQHLNPDRGWLETLQRCAGNDTQVAPLHCLILRIWAPLFGDSVWSLRAFSVLIGLLCVPAAAWLGHEVSAGEGVAATSIPIVAVILMAMSPFEVLFSQEAREYALWTLIVLLSSAALLRALRSSTTGAWVAYAALTAIGLYSHLLHVLVVMAQAIVARRVSWRQFVLSGGAGMLALIPWIVLLVIQATPVQEHVSWTGTRIPIDVYARNAIRNIAAVAIDFGMADLTRGQLAAELLIVACAGVALIWMLRRARRGQAAGASYLLVLLTLIVPVVLGSADLLRRGGSRMVVARYLVPSYVGLILIFACVIGALLDSGLRRRQAAGWIALLLFLAASGFSCRLMSYSEDWWNKGASHLNLPCAEIVRSASNPLLIVEPVGSNFGNLLPLTHLLDDRLQIVGEPPADLDFSRFDRVLVYEPSDAFLQRVQRRSGMTATLVANRNRANLYELRAP